MTDTKQEALLPETPPAVRTAVVQLAELAPDELLVSQPPSADLIESIRVYGVQAPLTVRLVPSVGIAGQPIEMYEVIEGRRRIKAARAAGLTEIRVTIVSLEDLPARLLSVQLNATRSDNPLSDLENLLAIADVLRRRGMAEREIERELGKRTHLSRSALWARLQFRHLRPEFMAAVRDKRVGLKVAEQIAKLTDELQSELITVLNLQGKVTRQDVLKLRQAQRSDTQIPFDPGEGADFNVVSVMAPVPVAPQVDKLLLAINDVLTAPKGHDKSSAAKQRAAMEALRAAKDEFDGVS